MQVPEENKSEAGADQMADRQSIEDSSLHDLEPSNLDAKSNSDCLRKPMKRREMNEEKKEMTSLFLELMMLVNQQVLKNSSNSPLLPEVPTKKAKSLAPQPQLKKKNTKTAKNNKEVLAASRELQRQKSCPEPQPSILPKANGEIPRKPSSCLKESPPQNLELVQKKKQILADYCQIMSYKIHESQQENVIRAEQGQYKNTDIKPPHSEEKRKFSIARSVQMVVVKPTEKPISINIHPINIPKQHEGNQQENRRIPEQMMQQEESLPQYSCANVGHLDSLLRMSPQHSNEAEGCDKKDDHAMDQQ